MKIIHILNHFLPYQTAGTEIYTWALSKELQKKGHDVKILIPNYGISESASYEYDNLIITRYAENSVVDRELIMGKRLPNGLHYFALFLEKEKPDIVHFHELAGSNGIGIAHIQEAKKLGSKIFITLHISNYSCMTGVLMQNGENLCNGLINIKKCSSCFLKDKKMEVSANLLASFSSFLHNCGIDTTSWNNSIGTALGTAKIVYNLKKNLYNIVDLCDKVICVSEWYHRFLVKNGVDSKKIKYIPQGIPVKYDLVVKEKPLSGKISLLYVGRISISKGLHLLLKALDKLPESEIELTIYGKGDGTEFESIWRNMTKHKSNIHWKGVIINELVHKEMQFHDLLCICSTTSEMSPLIIQEARAAKLPIIASNVYGNSEQIVHGVNGFLFKFNDASDLNYQLTLILKDPAQLKKIRENINPPLMFNAIAEQYLRLYNKV